MDKNLGSWIIRERLERERESIVRKTYEGSDKAFCNRSFHTFAGKLHPPADFILTLSPSQF